MKKFKSEKDFFLFLELDLRHKIGFSVQILYFGPRRFLIKQCE